MLSTYIPGGGGQISIQNQCRSCAVKKRRYRVTFSSQARNRRNWVHLSPQDPPGYIHIPSSSLVADITCEQSLIRKISKLLQEPHINKAKQLGGCEIWQRSRILILSVYKGSTLILNLFRFLLISFCVKIRKNIFLKM